MKDTITSIDKAIAGLFQPLSLLRKRQNQADENYINALNDLKDLVSKVATAEIKKKELSGVYDEARNATNNMESMINELKRSRQVVEKLI